MVQLHSVSNREQVIDTMIELTRLSSQLRAIVAGSDSLELYLALRRRGFARVSTTETCRIPKGQHAVGLITGENSLAAIEAALTRISPFLCANAAIAVLIDSREGGFCLKIRNKLEQMGFRIEAGVRCQQGLVLSAYRLPIVELAEPAKAEIACAIAEIGDEDPACPSEIWHGSRAGNGLSGSN